MLAMQRSYAGLRNKGSDLEYCEDDRIQDFFEQVGLHDSFEFDSKIEKFSKEEVQHQTEEAES